MKSPMAEATLYMYPGACSRVTMTALEEIGMPYQAVTINLGSGAQQSADYLALNRKGKVPTLSINGKVLTENAAILAFLDRLHPEAALLPHSDDLFEAALPLSDLIWCSSTLHPEVRQVRAPAKWTVGDPAGVHADGLKKFAKSCAYIVSRVEANRWWFGDWSIIDTYLYWAYSTAAKGGFPLNEYPALVSHADRVRARPSFQCALTRELAAVQQGKLSIDPNTL
jgi:glutathione S-transferase